MIVETQELTRSDIPVSYIMTNTDSYEIKINKLNAQFEETKEIRPFDVCNEEYYYFDSNENKIDYLHTELNENGQTVYLPENYTEFVPEKFRAEALVKRNVPYNNTDIFNMRISCFDEGTAEKLIAVFGDAPDRNICPNNITVNNKSTNVYSLIDSDIEENDFVFVRTIDGKAIKAEGDTQYLDYSRALSVHTNLWIGVDTFNGLKEVENDESGISFMYSKLYADHIHEIKTKDGFTYRFDVTKDIEDLPMDTYQYSNLFSDEYPPILLLEKENEGFIIISHNSFIDDIEKNIKLFYEILLHVFLSKYEKAISKESWITDNPIDYIGKQGVVCLKNHEEINLSKMLENKNCNIGDNYQLIAIDANNSNVIFTDIDSKNNLYFSKINKTDPAKKITEKTMFSINGTVIQYSEEVIMLIENKMNINVVNERYIRIDKCKSSKYRLNQEENTLLKIPDLAKMYYLVLVKTSDDSYFRLVDRTDYDYDFIKIAEIKTVLYNNIENIDIRKCGGGLPENIVEVLDDYNLQDISHLKGRPYRNAYTSVIKLPKRLQKYDGIIKTELEKHRAVGDNLMLLYD